VVVEPAAQRDLEAEAIGLVTSTFPSELVGEGQHARQRWIWVKPERIVEILTTLRDQLRFEMLMDLTVVDWLDRGRPERYEVVYQLYSITHNRYFRVKCWVPEDEAAIDSVVGVWKAADWAEREAYDLFGLTFRNHPNLKRILMPESYTGHPLRKDYPLTGRGERYDFPKHSR
jgi:NADH-quinone oxidoreductase subunit C